jgi:hypothetical protein
MVVGVRLWTYWKMPQELRQATSVTPTCSQSSSRTGQRIAFDGETFDQSRRAEPMPTAWKVEESCPQCGDDSDVWMFEKPEGSVKKGCYTCETCGCEWSEIIDR